MLKDQLNRDLKKYLKEKNTVALNSVRSVITEIKNQEVEKGKELSDEEIMKLIKKQVKMREDSIEQFEKAGRSDLVDKEEKELKLLKEYLPEELSEEELNKIVEETIKEVNASSKKDFAKVMKAVMQKAQGRADGKKINETVSKFLN
ncbi:glutamyl-tRNA amidotransferase [Petrotoga sp. 9PW.55.5.1]|uniref:GatB/YqeY domain-containing protein n=1 Tax=Petrotoga sp. 9PW.55.5.1 TaxID=1308979 RepID=UPI000DC58C2F|nr:GatB/YqeY domain-containing protein [Petrotoga sp. 9PW.55.5.1]RAO99240.1 glutamyl-tRNA amidotransferase [Petrotoga sp. 9PW.55.5.1]